MLYVHAVKSKDLHAFNRADLAEVAAQMLAHIGEQSRHISEQRLRIDSQAQAIKWRDAKIESITFQLARLKAWKFGARTEAMNAEQRSIFEETLAADQASLETQLAHLQPSFCAEDGKNPTQQPRRQPKREALPPHLPRVDQRVEPEDTNCPTPECGQPMVRVGEDISERLDIVPAQFFVQRQIRGKWVCRCCQLMVQERAAPQVFDNARPTPGLQAHTVISRFVDHLPYYRQEQINARSGVHTPRSTLAAWSGQTGAQLMPLYEAHRDFVLGSGVVHADETPIALLNPGAGKTTKAYMWAYARGAFEVQPGVVYDFCAGRGGKYPHEFLKGWTGTLVVDAYSGYEATLCLEGRMTANCLAHARRKFDELFKANASTVAAQTIGRIAGSVPHRGRRPGTELRAAAADAPGTIQTTVGRTACLVAARTHARARRQRNCQGHRLQPEPLAGAVALPERRRRADRQQPHRKPDAALGDRKTQLAFCWQPIGRRARRRGDEPAAKCQAQRTQSLGLPQGCPDKTAHAAQQPNRRAAAPPLAQHQLMPRPGRRA